MKTHRAINRTGSTLSIAAFFLAGLSSGSTLPIASGNQWVYSYRNVKADDRTDDLGSSLGTRITTEGILTLTIGAVTWHSDSTFFSITYSDSGLYIFQYHTGGLSGTKDSSADSAYKGSCAKDYLVVNDAIYQVGSYGGWQPENDIQLTYTPQIDSTYLIYYSRKTTPVVVHVGPDSAEGYKKVFTSSFGNGGIGIPNYSSKDTLCWSDKFGTVLNDTGWTSSFYGEDGSSDHSFSSRYVLLSFRNVPTGIANPAKGSSTRCVLSHPAAARKAAMIYPATKAALGTRFFSLTGRQLTNRIGRQVLILAP